MGEQGGYDTYVSFRSYGLEGAGEEGSVWGSGRWVASRWEAVIASWGRERVMVSRGIEIGS